ncbi:MAG: hypothetical protein AAF495_25425 [Pseudomonadota bacterium]
MSLRKPLSAALIALPIIACLQTPASASTVQNAEFSSTEFRADIVYHVTWEPSAEKWWVGQCIDFTTGQDRRTRLYETDNRFRADIEVRLVSNRFTADRVFCTD